MSFFKQVVASIGDRAFYRELKTGKTADAVKYFAKLLVVVAVFISLFPIVGGLGLYFWNKDQVEDVQSQIVAAFPEELELRVKDGTVTSNVPEPYAIPLPEEWRMEQRGGGDRQVENLAVIDTTKPIDTADFAAYRTAVIIGRDEIGFASPDDRKIQIHRIDDWDVDVLATRDSFGAFVDRGFQALRGVGAVLLVLSPLFIFSGLFIGSLIYLVFGALIIWLAARLHHVPLTYGESYRYGLHLMTLPVLLSCLLTGLFKIPFVFTIVLFATAYWNLKPAIAAETPGPMGPTPSPAPEAETKPAPVQEQPKVLKDRS